MVATPNPGTAPRRGVEAAGLRRSRRIPSLSERSPALGSFAGIGQDRVGNPLSARPARPVGVLHGPVPGAGPDRRPTRSADLRGVPPPPALRGKADTG